MPPRATERGAIGAPDADEALEEGIGEDELVARQEGGAPARPEALEDGDEVHAGADVGPVTGVAGGDEELTPLKPWREAP
eukprot:13217192-Alexandrium_andersonii.AAC.1